jgi:hypothetical protein
MGLRGQHRGHDRSRSRGRCAAGGAAPPLTTVAGPSVVGAEGLAAYMTAYVPDLATIPGHAERLLFIATVFGIRGEVMLAQEVHETGWYTFPGCGRDAFGGCAEFNNYAGLKTPDGSAIARFDSPFLGVLGHAAHLAWYVFPKHVNAFCGPAYDPRHLGTGHRDSVVNVADLGGPGRWAPSIEYGNRVQARLDHLMAFEARRVAYLSRA